jgi:glycosyltransferase involved in cell wall biosynthesis
LRLAVYTDYSYRRHDGDLYGERAFVLFLGRLAQSFDRLIVPGRLDERPGKAHYRVDDAIEFVPLPFYERVTKPLQAGWAWLRSLRVFWCVLGEVDAVWLLGPHPLCIVFWAMARLRGRKVALGVRQNTPVYVRARHPGKRAVHFVADVLDGAYRLLARRCPTVVVGPELAECYAAAPKVLEIAVTLVDDADVVEPEQALQRSYDGELQALSVGRLETEKNPLLLAEIMKRLADSGSRWRLLVCGEGPMTADLEARLDELGVSDRVGLAGYVPLDGGLHQLYRDSHALLHVSWTEGVPQVLYEAFAAGTPVVATAVGGVEQAVGDSALLVQAGDAEAPASALERIAAEPQLRERLVRSGVERVRARTLEAEARRVAEFISAG